MLPRSAERGGVLLRVNGAEGDDAFGFVPAEIARRVTALSALTPVPGVKAPVVGIALADGAVVTVLRLGPSRPAHEAPAPASLGEGSAHHRGYEPGEDWTVPGADRAVLCAVGAFEVALTGASVVATGVFDAAPGGEGVLWRSEIVPVLDVRAIYAQAEAATWAERAASHPARAGSTPAGDGGKRAILPQTAEPGDDGDERGRGS